MPICNKQATATAIATAKCNEIADHTSEAAKVRRTREQAYFNSYNFDAIDILPCNDDDDYNVVDRVGGDVYGVGVGAGDDVNNNGVAVAAGHKAVRAQLKDDTVDHQAHQQQQQQPHIGEVITHYYNNNNNNNTSTTSKNTANFVKAPSTTTTTTTTTATLPNYTLKSQHQQQQQQQQQRHQHAHIYRKHSSLSSKSSSHSSVISSRSDANAASTELSHSQCGTSQQSQQLQQQQQLQLQQPLTGIFAKFTYLQRLGILFGASVDANEQQQQQQQRSRAAKDNTTTPANATTTTTPITVQQQQQQRQTIIKHDNNQLVGVTEATIASTAAIATATSAQPATGENVDANFLLPRAMLKYQSVGATGNSMPLAVITTPSTHVRSNKFVPHAYTSYHYNNNNHNNSSSSNNTIGNNNNFNKSNGSNASTGKTSALSKPSLATKVNYVTVNVSSAPTRATPIIPATVALATRHKKTSTSSSIGTSIASIAEEEYDDIDADDDSGQIVAQPMVIGTTDVRLEAKRLDGIGSGISKTLKESQTAIATTAVNNTTIKSTNKTGPTTTAGAATKTKVGAESEKRGRANSHQSHYSTEKSGSSGYYSSNVCSTYSMEDHIYCEPVIDVVRDRNIGAVSGGKSSGCVTNGGGSGSSAGGGGVRLDDTSPGVGSGIPIGKDLCSVQRQASALALEASALANRGTRHARQHLSEHLRILETSIENLDRHLKRYPSLTAQDRIASFVQSHHPYLPTIVEASPPPAPPPTGPAWSCVDQIDDSLLDIDLDSFLLVNERKGSQRMRRLKAHKTATNGGGGSGEPDTGIDNPSFLTEEQEENHRKCANYINSCPEDAYRVESDIVAEDGTAASEKSLSIAPTAAHYPKRYEDQLHFESTRELLQDVRDKIRLLSRSTSSNESGSGSGSGSGEESGGKRKELLPKELEGMIRTLKYELECYLARMNHHSELEIRQLCTGLGKRDNIVRMQKAFERRRSSIASLNYSVQGATHIDIESNVAAATYEVIRDVHHLPHHPNDSIRSACDPNFKLKRKSLADIFPPTVAIASTHSRSITPPPPLPLPTAMSGVAKSQIQRNLSFHQPVLQQLDVHHPGSSTMAANAPAAGTANGAASHGASGDFGEKDSILEWHRKKPSIWEMYYGTNRMNQSLLGKRNAALSNNPSGASSGQPTMSYPSSRPESDFTLDLPRAEQLRIKMEKEKKFRQRCRYITTFLSLVFFLLTVMVVSLVLTRGKRMFGSMI